jgi:hypothetical protein
LAPTGTHAQEGWLLLIGGGAAIVGSLLGMVGKTAHPITPIGDPEEVADVIAHSDGWLLDHLAVVVGIILMFGVFVALADSVRGELAEALARLGQASGLVGSQP